jgi:hypothetical protein
MIPQKKYFIVVCIIASFFFSESYAQSKKSTDEKWNLLQDSAHKIGFCIYQVNRGFCNKHSDIKHQLEKISEPESDIYYFEMKSSWANKRLHELAKTKKSNSADYLMLFDIDQKSTKKLQDSTKTSNSYVKFSVFDLKYKYQFKDRQKTVSNVAFYISSNTKQTILTNTMWREFFSNRLGRFDTEIKISLNGKNALADYSNFKEAFMKFTEK